MERIRKVALGLVHAVACLAAFAQWQVGQRAFQSSASAPRLDADLMGLDAPNFDLSFGGVNTLYALQFVYSQFQQQAPNTYPAADICHVSYNGKIYIIGGVGSSTSVYETYVQIYNPVTDTWSQGTQMTAVSPGVWGAGCDQYNGTIYVFGGATAATGQSGTLQAIAYNIAGDSWSTLTDLPSAVADGSLVVTVGNYLYIEWDGDFWKFDPSAAGGAGSYTALTTPPSGAQVQWAATGYFNISGDDRIYYLGGSYGSNTYTNTAYYYSVTNGTWSSALATAPYAAHGMVQRAIYGGLLYFIGGFDGTYFYRDLYSYNPSTNTWSGKLATTNAWADGIGGGFVGNVLYVIGGRNAQNGYAFGIARNESFQIGSNPSAQTFTKLQLAYASAGSGSVDMGIYADASGSPGALILDAGPATVASPWTAITGLSVSSLTPGTYYWLAFVQNSSNPVMYTNGQAFNPNAANAGCYASMTYGALPSTFPSPTCYNNSTYGIKLTVN